MDTRREWLREPNDCRWGDVIREAVARMRERGMTFFRVAPVVAHDGIMWACLDAWAQPPEDQGPVPTVDDMVGFF